MYIQRERNQRFKGWIWAVGGFVIYFVLWVRRSLFLFSSYGNEMGGFGISRAGDASIAAWLVQRSDMRERGDGMDVYEIEVDVFRWWDPDQKRDQ